MRLTIEVYWCGRSSKYAEWRLITPTETVSVWFNRITNPGSNESFSRQYGVWVAERLLKESGKRWKTGTLVFEDKRKIVAFLEDLYEKIDRRSYRKPIVKKMLDMAKAG